MKVSFIRSSQNTKTGPLPVTYSSKETCPLSCPLLNKGCYAKYGPTLTHWNAITRGERGIGWEQLLAEIRDLPRGILWRHNIAGDLPSTDRVTLDEDRVMELAEANRGRRGFCFTHYDPFIPHNKEVIRKSMEAGFVVNLSADDLHEADRMVSLGVAPVAVVLPMEVGKHLRTPEGNKVVVCPATYRKDITCVKCGICQHSGDRAIVGFPAHGTHKRWVSQMARQSAYSLGEQP